ncbi:MAG: SigB/SigF/SigG family RNA polymerase sigma factor [Clostridiaceae bacterium]|jgi:RNA polymerase sigma-B factor|nr:SigB/SigF/SigG family RNA polymerase sigma factor [Clostridiaceae bacterium]
MQIDKKLEKQDAVSDRDLFIKYRESNDVNIRNEIVSRYTYLAEILAKKFVNRGVEYDDLFQVACVALINAVERFDVDVKVKFVSFATPTIIGEIQRYFRDKASIIRVPRRIYEVYKKVNNAREALTQKKGRPPTVEEIAEYSNLSEETILETMESWNVYRMQSFDQAVFDDEDSKLHEAIGEDDESFERIINRDFLSKSMQHFDDIEKKFIYLRYFDNKTQKDIAANFGVSQMYVSRLERKTLEKFRKILRK